MIIIEDNEWILVNNNVKPHSTGKEGDVLHDGIDKSDSHPRREISKNNNNIVVEEGFSVLDLNPETHYKLRMTAHNSAGSTVGVYGFTTLTFGGATVAPELIIHSEYSYGFLNLLLNPGVVLPVLLALIVIVVIMAFVGHQIKKERAFFRGM